MDGLQYGPVNSINCSGDPYGFRESPPEQLYRCGWLDNAENREEYRPGGFHPVHIGDYLGENNRFRIVHKLGNGGLATYVQITS